MLPFSNGCTVLEFHDSFFLLRNDLGGRRFAIKHFAVFFHLLGGLGSRAGFMSSGEISFAFAFLVLRAWPLSVLPRSKRQHE